MRSNSIPNSNSRQLAGFFMGEQMIATIASREADAQMIAEALRSYRGPIEVIPGPPETPPPANFRRDWIDPTTVRKPKRKERIKTKLIHELTPEELAYRRERERARSARNRAAAAQEWQA